MLSNTTLTDLPKRPKSIACCVMWISASSCEEQRSCWSILTPRSISTGTSPTPAITRECFCVALLWKCESISPSASMAFNWIFSVSKNLFLSRSWHFWRQLVCATWPSSLHPREGFDAVGKISVKHKRHICPLKSLKDKLLKGINIHMKFVRWPADDPE